MRYKLNIQRFAGPIPYSITVNGEDFTIVRTRDDINTTWEIDQSANSTLYSINNSKVIWKNGGILQYNGVDVLPTDLINADSAYTTRASEPTIGKNNLRLGSITPKGYYLGTKKVIKMYLGSTLIYELSSLPQLSTPQNVVVEDTTLSFDEVENAEEYEVFVDNVSIGSYQVSKGETWLLNSDISSAEDISVSNLSFVSNSQNFTSIICTTGKGGANLSYNQTGVFVSTWENEAYRTITFDSPVTDSTLLTWLQANGVKQ